MPAICQARGLGPMGMTPRRHVPGDTAPRAPDKVLQLPLSPRLLGRRLCRPFQKTSFLRLPLRQEEEINHRRRSN